MSAAMDSEEASSSSNALPATESNTPATPKPVKKVKKHATVYQKNALYGAYRFWRKKNEDLRARGVDVGFEWKELFEFFGFAKTTGFKVIKDADQDPTTLLRKDETGWVETRGRKPKMSEEQIQAVEKLLQGQDPFQEGIEWKVIAKQLDLDVHKHTVRRTLRRTLQSRRKQSSSTPSRPAPVNKISQATTTDITTPAPIAPSMQRPNHEVNNQIIQPQAPSISPIPQAIGSMPANLDPRIMAMSAQQHSQGANRTDFEADMARLLANAP